MTSAAAARNVSSRCYPINDSAWWSMLRVGGSGRRAAAREEAPHHQHNDGADHGTDQPGTLVGVVPAERLAEIGRDEGAGDAERRGEDEARRLVGAGGQEFRDDAATDADDDEPENPDWDAAPPLLRSLRALRRVQYVRAENAAGGTLVPCSLR